MSDTFVVANSHRRISRRRISGTIGIAGLALGMLAAPLQPSFAQEAAPSATPSLRPWKIHFTSGAFVATGAQRGSFKDAQLSAVGLAWRVAPSLSVTGAFSWARSRALDYSDRSKVDVFNSDLGLEAETREWSPARVFQLRLFAGGGAGMRSYHYRADDLDATNHPAGYLALGADVGVSRVGVRIEARDYASRFTSTGSAGRARTRNDLVISAGLHFRKRASAPRAQ